MIHCALAGMRQFMKEDVPEGLVNLPMIMKEQDRTHADDVLPPFAHAFGHGRPSIPIGGVVQLLLEEYPSLGYGYPPSLAILDGLVEDLVDFLQDHLLVKEDGDGPWGMRVLDLFNP